MKRKTILTALLFGLLAATLLGCGGSNKLQSIQLNVALVNGTQPGAQGGLFSLQGNGGTIQLQALGTYSSSKTKDLTNVVTYNVIVDPVHNMDAFGNTLLPPCKTPCSDPSQGTLEYNPTGLLTSVEPATCTWVDVFPDATDTAWYYVGDYQVTATFGGLTSQPVYIPIASSAGNPNDIFDGITGNNPKQLCGPGN